MQNRFVIDVKNIYYHIIIEFDVVFNDKIESIRCSIMFLTDDMIEEKSLIARIRGEHGYLRGRRGELANNIVISDISVSHTPSSEGVMP